MGALISTQNYEDYYDDVDDGSCSDEEGIVFKNSENVLCEQGHDQPQEAEKDLCDRFSNIDICMDSATDAIDAESVPQTVPIVLSLSDVRNIEEQLEVYEKVSLIYLLEDNTETALQNLTDLLNIGSGNCLYNWSKRQNVIAVNWEEKFVEALCIIQNYQVLKNLGYKKKDLDVRFLPRYFFTSNIVNKVRKSLYILCESLTQKEANNLVKLVLEDITSKGLATKYFDSSFLEFYLLYWNIIGYIKQDNLNNLYPILKQLDHLELVDQLKQVVPVVVANTTLTAHRSEQYPVKNKTVDANTKKSLNTFEVLLDDRVDIASLESNMGSDNITNVIADNKYNIDPNNPGVCLIINEEYFYTEPDEKYHELLPQHGNRLETRIGTKNDKDELEAVFKMFGFKTEVVENLTHIEMITKIESVIQSITTESSLFICIMSHGDEGVIYGVNSCRVSVKSIKAMMCRKNRNNLLGKPKILILQSCQGTRCQKISSTTEQEEYVTTDSPTSNKQETVLPPLADLFTFWATVPGYGAIRDKRTGSWFIQSLCEKMKTFGNKVHFEDICTAVIDNVSSKIWSQKTEAVAMVPLKDSTLRKLLFLPPIKDLLS